MAPKNLLGLVSSFLGQSWHNASAPPLKVCWLFDPNFEGDHHFMEKVNVLARVTTAAAVALWTYKSPCFLTSHIFHSTGRLIK